MPVTTLKTPELLFVRGSAGMMPRLDRDDALHRIRPGAYMQRAEWNVLKPWERYSARVRAVAGTRSSPLFCLESAAILLGLPTFGEPRDIHLFDPDGGKTWRDGDVVVHASLDRRQVEMIEGGAATSIADTAVDLCRVLPPAFGLAVADAAAGRTRGETELLVADRGRRQQNRRGVRRLDWVQERTDPVSESVGESVSRAVIEWLGYECPEPQIVFRSEGVEDRVDFFWRERNVVGESDGYGKYDAEDPESSKQHFIAEKRREDRLRRHVDGFARWDWGDVMSGVRLDSILASAGLNRVRQRDQALLATLRSNPRSRTPEGRPSSPARRDRASQPKQGAASPDSA